MRGSVPIRVDQFILEGGEASDEVCLVRVDAETIALEESLVGGFQGGFRHLILSVWLYVYVQ